MTPSEWVMKRIHIDNMMNRPIRLGGWAFFVYQPTIATGSLVPRVHPLVYADNLKILFL